MRSILSAKDMKKILLNNGYRYVRSKGSHFIYSNGVSTISINKDLNCMVAKRLVKEYNLEISN